MVHGLGLAQVAPRLQRRIERVAQTLDLVLHFMDNTLVGLVALLLELLEGLDRSLGHEIVELLEGYVALVKLVHCGFVHSLSREHGIEGIRYTILHIL